MIGGGRDGEEAREKHKIFLKLRNLTKFPSTNHRKISYVKERISLSNAIHPNNFI